MTYFLFDRCYFRLEFYISLTVMSSWTYMTNDDVSLTLTVWCLILANIFRLRNSFKLLASDILIFCYKLDSFIQN